MEEIVRVLRRRTQSSFYHSIGILFPFFVHCVIEAMLIFQFTTERRQEQTLQVLLQPEVNVYRMVLVHHTQLNNIERILCERPSSSHAYTCGVLPV